MKHLIFSFALLVFGTGLHSQNSQMCKEIKQALQNRHPELQLEDKILAVNFWSVSDENSRKANAAFEKACSTYVVAKLKGGRKGLVVVLVNKDNLNDFSVVSLNKEGIKCCYSFQLSDLPEQSLNASKNQVFDANGNLLFSNLNPEQIFSSIHSLITR